MEKTLKSRWVWLLWGFLLFLPFQFALNVQEGVDLASIRVVIGALFLVGCAIIVVQKRYVIPTSFSFWLGISFFIGSFLSILWAQEPSWALRKGLFLLNFFLFFLFAYGMFFWRKWNLSHLAQGLSFTGVSSALVALGQVVFSQVVGVEKAIAFWRITITPFFLGGTFSETVSEYSSWAVNIGGVTFFRAIGFFPDPHVAAFFWEICLVWSLFYAYKRQSLLYGIFSGIILAGLLLTFSRGAYVGIGLFLFLGTFFFIGMWKYARLFFLLFSGVIFFGIFLLFFTPIPERALSSFSLGDTSNQGRLALWEQATQFLSQEPWGIGLGNYPLYVLPSAEYRDPIYAHNLYLDISVDSGLIVGFLWIFWLVSVMLIGWKRKKKNFYGNAILFSLLVFSGHAFFDTPIYSVHILPLLLLVFASVGVFEGSKEKRL